MKKNLYLLILVITSSCGVNEAFLDSDVQLEKINQRILEKNLSSAELEKIKEINRFYSSQYLAFKDQNKKTLNKINDDWLSKVNRIIYASNATNEVSK